jgi:hypothetical protein
MRLFEMAQLKEAIKFAEEGGQALHLHTFNSGHFLFRRYPVISHLFDMDKDRLVETARSLGVNVIKIEREGERGQHIDLCAGPLERAKKLAIIHPGQEHLGDNTFQKEK